MPVEDLKSSPMMEHLLVALDKGEDVGHYGRLVFVMVGQHFLSEEELVTWLAKDADCDEQKAHTLLAQVKARGYNPPKPDRIMQWMQEQDFPICETNGTGDECNVYKTLKFPPEVYERIASYYARQN